MPHASTPIQNAEPCIRLPYFSCESGNFRPRRNLIHHEAAWFGTAYRARVWTRIAHRGSGLRVLHPGAHQGALLQRQRGKASPPCPAGRAACHAPAARTGHLARLLSATGRAWRRTLRRSRPKIRLHLRGPARRHQRSQRGGVAHQRQILLGCRRNGIGKNVCPRPRRRHKSHARGDAHLRRS